MWETAIFGKPAPPTKNIKQCDASWVHWPVIAFSDDVMFVTGSPSDSGGRFARQSVCTGPHRLEEGSSMLSSL